MIPQFSLAQAQPVSRPKCFSNLNFVSLMRSQIDGLCSILTEHVIGNNSSCRTVFGRSQDIYPSGSFRYPERASNHSRKIVLRVTYCVGHDRQIYKGMMRWSDRENGRKIYHVRLNYQAQCEPYGMI